MAITMNTLREYVQQFDGVKGHSDAEEELLAAVVFRRTDKAGKVDYEQAMRDLERMQRAMAPRGEAIGTQALTDMARSLQSTFAPAGVRVGPAMRRAGSASDRQVFIDRYVRDNT